MTNDKPLMDIHQLLTQYAQGDRLFSKVNLCEAHLSGTNLSRGVFRDAILQEINLSSAYLRRTDFRGADLKGADLRGAYLKGADLRGTDLRWADMGATDISHALYNSQTQFPLGFDPKGRNAYAIAPKADLSLAYLYKADLRWTKLTDANLTQAYLYRADLRSADLRGSDLSEANLHFALCDADTCFDEEFDANRAGVYWIRPQSSLVDATLSGARLSGVDLSGADLSGADLTRADLSRANLEKANLSGANLTGANLLGANLLGAKITDAEFAEADLLGAIAPDGSTTMIDLQKSAP
ncbi:pentapeptide repeat-containing protein [Phormidium pseudopriestleyi FRX01]|uniref:Pentapeptide repeat-containing protein n=1 Tax=Phormidium pseudopriestleyi FRX01 TaxID=1759528 RepID=A0ABS3FVS2_9CYAN|nr:pentapeptide repeat-containing protein [Phormidium pseudopriestleyi]MBO0350873.1 pentapeptide repeat-containing protein [Phormidium pseudopriestleyi FRX01]